MMPYVGTEFESPAHRKMLIIGESFYFPHDATVHLDPGAWYGKKQCDLDEEEREWIDCRKLLECLWQADGHEMYRELNRRIGELGLPCTDRAVSNIAFMNAFLRPASVPGRSFEYCCSVNDIEISNRVLPAVLGCLRPDIIVFASIYSWRTLGARLAESHRNMAFDYVCHPTTGGRYWTKPGYEHGRPKFMNILRTKLSIA